MNAAALVLLLAWTLFAFGGVYTWAFVPALIVSVLGVTVTRAFTSRTPDRVMRVLDVALWCSVLAALVQLVPLPGALRDLLSPQESQYFARILLVAPDSGDWRPLSLVPQGWVFGVGVLAATIATFWWARASLHSRQVRDLVRWVAWIALAVAVVALIQPAVFPSNKIYGFWTPESRGAHPVGPIVSRNHFAAWVVLAWPLIVGYLIAHASIHWRHVPARKVALILGDTRALWLLVSAALLAAALLITESRAGVMGFAVAALVMVARTWKRSGTRGRLGIMGLVVALVLAVSLWASPAAVMNRFDSAWSGADGGRPEIWRETRGVIALFPITGIGLGAFDVVMPVYQQIAHTILINHAHNQYLHVMAEGGLLVGIPLAVALLTFVLIGRRRLGADTTAMVHVREGAMAGLCGLALLGLFDVPSLTPAVILLAAVNAAIVVYRDDTSDRSVSPRGEGAT
jgi:O-antigen ligase